MAELLPWIDTNFRTHGDAAGRAVAGFSMGGFGALKYTAKYPELFSAVTSLSGPASLRGLGGLVTHWANATGKLDNGLAFGVYGAPWNQRRVSADNPVEHIEAYRNKRIALYCGTGVDHPLRQEPAVRTTQGDFSALLTRAGIEHTWVQHAGAHGALVRENMTAEIPEIVAHLRPAG